MTLVNGRTRSPRGKAEVSLLRKQISPMQEGLGEVSIWLTASLGHRSFTSPSCLPVTGGQGSSPTLEGFSWMACHWLIQVKIAHMIMYVDTVGAMPSLPTVFNFSVLGKYPKRHPYRISHMGACREMEAQLGKGSGTLARFWPSDVPQAVGSSFTSGKYLYLH